MTSYARTEVLLIILAALCCCGKPCPPWDDDYANVTASAAGNAPAGGATYARRILEESRRFWPSNSAYLAIREKVREDGIEARSAVRVEIGNQSIGKYRCVWIVERRARTMAYAATGRGIVRLEIATAEWEEYKQFLEDTPPWHLGSHVNSGAFDDDAIFVSLCFSGRVVQFGTYGLLPLVDMEESRGRFDEVTRTHRRIIMRTLDLARDAIGAEFPR